MCSQSTRICCELLSSAEFLQTSSLQYVYCSINFFQHSYSFYHITHIQPRVSVKLIKHSQHVKWIPRFSSSTKRLSIPVLSFIEILSLQFCYFFRVTVTLMMVVENWVSTYAKSSVTSLCNNVWLRLLAITHISSFNCYARERATQWRRR